MKHRWLLLAVLFMVACAGSSKRYASIEPASKLLFIQAPTGKTGCSPHSLGPYSEIAWINVGLPEIPPRLARYEASRLSLTQGVDAPLNVIGGFVEIDREKRQVNVALTLASGAYWANGTYPLRAP